jgi:ubiquinone/menaquinone biosynthesis C-methylase UbiE
MTAPADLQEEIKSSVADFWERASCGEAYAEGDTLRERFRTQAAARYELEPYLHDFARFRDGAGRDVLEIGVGMGADHLKWAKSRPRSLIGVDLTTRAARWTAARLQLEDFSAAVGVGDAERLPFDDNSFDIVYSWGVLHHSPNTANAIREVRRVLRPGGRARIMVYHKYSIIGVMLWLRYALGRGQISRSLSDIYAEQLESPGTKAYSRKELEALFEGYTNIHSTIELSVGDLMIGVAGQRHQGRLLELARAIWPRALIRKTMRHYGLNLMIEATK